MDRVRSVAHFKSHTQPAVACELRVQFERLPVFAVGNALGWSTDAGFRRGCAGNVSAAGADGTREGFMTTGRQYGGCFWEGCCDPEQGERSGDSGGGNCTERALDTSRMFIRACKAVNYRVILTQLVTF